MEKRRNKPKIWVSLIMVCVMVFSCFSTAFAAENSTENAAETDPDAGKDIMILYTSDVHCGIDEGFGYVGLQQVRDSLEDMGYVTILMDNGNAIQGEAIGGQQILDALEWGARSVPEEFGGFLQVSGLHYEIDLSVLSGCKTDENNMFVGIEGERRVKNVTVGGESLDPEQTYTVAGQDYVLLEHGDGFTMFDNPVSVPEHLNVDIQIIMDYLEDTLQGEVPDQYAEPYGEGRIVIWEEQES